MADESPLRFEIIPVTPFQQNCSLVWDARDRRAALIDAGGESERLLERVRHHDLKLEKLLVTHGHLDHVGAVGELAQRLGLPIEGPHRGDDYWLEWLPLQARQFGFPAATTFRPDRWLDQGDTVTVGGLTFEVLHCPGHTPGHVVLFQREARLAFVGDVLFAGAVGRSDFPGGDGPALLRAIRERLFPLGDDIRFVPGHGPMSTFGTERRDNPYVGERAA